MQFSLNYVWIEAARLPLPQANEVCMCTIPEDLLNNVIAVAKTYPQLPISLWVDIYGVGNHPEGILDELNGEVNESNITFRALDEIPAYKTNDLFKKPSVDLNYSNDPLWQQADLARLYVLNHCLTVDCIGGAIYADMDLDLTTKHNIAPCHPFLETSNNSGTSVPFSRAVKKLKEYGLAVSCEDSKMTAENQLIGVSLSGYRFFREMLIPMTAKTIRDGWNGWYGHTDAFRDMFLKPYGIKFDDIKVEIPTIDPRKEIKKSYVSSRTTPKGTGTITIPLALSVPRQP